MAAVVIAYFELTSKLLHYSHLPPIIIHYRTHLYYTSTLETNCRARKSYVHPQNNCFNACLPSYYSCRTGILKNRVLFLLFVNYSNAYLSYRTLIQNDVYKWKINKILRKALKCYKIYIIICCRSVSIRWFQVLLRRVAATTICQGTR